MEAAGLRPLPLRQVEGLYGLGLRLVYEDGSQRGVPLSSGDMASLAIQLLECTRLHYDRLTTAIKYIHAAIDDFTYTEARVIYTAAATRGIERSAPPTSSAPVVDQQRVPETPVEWVETARSILARHDKLLSAVLQAAIVYAKDTEADHIAALGRLPRTG